MILLSEKKCTPAQNHELKRTDSINPVNSSQKSHFMWVTAPPPQSPHEDRVSKICLCKLSAYIVKKPLPYCVRAIPDLVLGSGKTFQKYIIEKKLLLLNM